MSNLGLQILYAIINSHPQLSAERSFAPWLDMEEIMRQHKLPLFSLETHQPIKSFDVVGFTLQYEMTYTNILNLLDLAELNLFSKDRNKNDPLVIAGGPGAFNPEPLAPFFDLFVIGEAEEIIIPLLLKCLEHKRKANFSRKELLKELANWQGIYVPEFYRYDKQAKSVFPINHNFPKKITKLVVKNLDQVKVPTKNPIPYCQIIHDRAMVEIMRGCSHGCRFCQAGVIYRPTRERSVSKIISSAKEIIKNSGYQEISLTSLSSADYSLITQLTTNLSKKLSDKRATISLPSLRLDSFSVELAKQVSQVRKTSLTFAPEAGTARLRQVINKIVSEQDLMTAIKTALEAGWRRIKLYFMIGLPTETTKDLEGIVDLANKCLLLARNNLKKSDFKRFRLIINVSSFVPKSQTPFQWVAMNSLSEIEEKQDFLRQRLPRGKIIFKWHDSKLSVVEGLIARGNRQIANVIYDAWRLGCKFDGWSDQFNFALWDQACKKNGINLASHNNYEINISERLPWEHISAGVDREWLMSEYLNSLKGEKTDQCRNFCSECGVCDQLDVHLRLTKNNDKKIVYS
jgi:radical SAM family uncharacterized protein